jgi:predicted phage-related endonuclease
MTSLGLSDKQQEIRLSGVGASEVWDVLNGGIATYARKVGEAEPFEGNSLTEFGHRGERILGEAWVDRHAVEDVRIYTPGTLRHSQHEWALASPDRVVARPGAGRPAREDWLRLLEMKWVFFSSSEYGEGADEVPEHHVVQVQWQLEVTDMEEATLVACVNGDYREYPLQRDREMGGLLIDAVGKWWRDHVVARVPPPVDGSQAYTDYLKRKYPADRTLMLPASTETEAIVARLREAKAATKAAEDAEEKIENQLRAVIGDAAGIEKLCTWKANRASFSSTTDWEAVAFAFAQQHNLQIDTQLIVDHTTQITKPGARVLRLSKRSSP